MIGLIIIGVLLVLSVVLIVIHRNTKYDVEDIGTVIMIIFAVILVAWSLVFAIERIESTELCRQYPAKKAMFENIDRSKNDATAMQIKLIEYNEKIISAQSYRQHWSYGIYYNPKVMELKIINHK